MILLHRLIAVYVLSHMAVATGLVLLSDPLVKLSSLSRLVKSSVMASNAHWLEPVHSKRS